MVSPDLGEFAAGIPLIQKRVAQCEVLQSCDQGKLLMVLAI